MVPRPLSLTIFGILNIGFGVLGIFSSIVFMALSSLPQSAAESPLLKALHNEMAKMNAWDRLQAPIGAVAAVALIVMGIGLLRTLNWARVGSIVYGIYSIVVILISTGLKVINAPSLMMVIISIFGLLFALIYPILLIVFMVRPIAVAATRRDVILA